MPVILPLGRAKPGFRPRPDRHVHVPAHQPRTPHEPPRHTENEPRYLQRTRRHRYTFPSVITSMLTRIFPSVLLCTAVVLLLFALSQPEASSNSQRRASAQKFCRNL